MTEAKKPITCCRDFWEWVAARQDPETPRGDFIRDTRFLVEAGLEPCERVHRLGDNPEGMKAYNRLRGEWNRASGYQPPPHFCPKGRKLHNGQVSPEDLRDHLEGRATPEAGTTPTP